VLLLPSVHGHEAGALPPRTLTSLSESSLGTAKGLAEAVNGALDEHIKDFDAFMNAMERKWPTATAEERDQMQRDFVSLMRRAGQIAQLMDGDRAAPN
jgi:hypothetical protein